MRLGVGLFLIVVQKSKKNWSYLLFFSRKFFLYLHMIRGKWMGCRSINYWFLDFKTALVGGLWVAKLGGRPCRFPGTFARDILYLHWDVLNFKKGEKNFGNFSGSLISTIKAENILKIVHFFDPKWLTVQCALYICTTYLVHM